MDSISLKDSYELYIPSRRPYVSAQALRDKLSKFSSSTIMHYTIYGTRFINFEDSTKNNNLLLDKALVDETWNIIIVVPSIILGVPSQTVAQFCVILDKLIKIHPEALVALKDTIAITMITDAVPYIDFRYECTNFEHTALNTSSGILDEGELADFLTVYQVQPDHLDLPDILSYWKCPLYVCQKEWFTKSQMYTKFPRLSGITNYLEFFDNIKISNVTVYRFRLTMEAMLRLFGPVSFEKEEID